MPYRIDGEAVAIPGTASAATRPQRSASRTSTAAEGTDSALRRCKRRVQERRAREGWTRRGSPGILGKFGGVGASPPPSLPHLLTTLCTTLWAQTPSILTTTTPPCPD